MPPAATLPNRGAASMEDTPTAETQGYPALMQPRITQPKARPFRVVASERHYPLAGWRRCWSRGDPHPFEFEDSGRPCAAPDGDGWRVEAVSYTHLTLPTIE